MGAPIQMAEPVGIVRFEFHQFCTLPSRFLKSERVYSLHKLHTFKLPLSSYLFISDMRVSHLEMRFTVV